MYCVPSLKILKWIKGGITGQCVMYYLPHLHPNKVTVTFLSTYKVYLLIGSGAERAGEIWGAEPPPPGFSATIIANAA